MRLLALYIALTLLLPQTICINFYLTPGVKKCLQEEVHKNDIVSGEYHVYQEIVDIPVKVIVTDNREQTLYKKDDATEGKFGFTIDYSGPYTVCFHTLPAPSNVQVNSLRVCTALLDLLEFSIGINTICRLS